MHLLTCYGLLFHAISVSSLLTRDDEPSSTAHINTTVIDHAGHDVTPHFKTMLYHIPTRKKTSDLNDRQVAYVRKIDECGEYEGIFVDSSCKHKNRVLGSLQAYTYRCVVYVPNTRFPRYGRRMINTHNGTCQDDEICVTGMGDNQLRGNNSVEMAHCVKTEAYTRLASGQRATQLEESFKDVRLDVALSDIKKTPLKADSINTQSESSALGGAKGSKSVKSCIDCLDLDTAVLPAGTDYLSTEVHLLATTVTAGILWLTLFSG